MTLAQFFVVILFMKVKLSKYAKMSGVSVRTLYRRISEGNLAVERSSTGQLINADINGSLNILRKVVRNVPNGTNLIEACSTPSVFTVKLN